MCKVRLPVKLRWSMDNKQQKLTKALFKHKIGQGFCDGRLKEGGGRRFSFSPHIIKEQETRETVSTVFYRCFHSVMAPPVCRNTPRLCAALLLPESCRVFQWNRKRAFASAPVKIRYICREPFCTAFHSSGCLNNFCSSSASTIPL